MKVFTCTDHDGHWVGVASVIVAADQERAAAILRAELASRLLKPEGFTLQALDLDTEQAIVLQDGDY